MTENIYNQKIRDSSKKAGSGWSIRKNLETLFPQLSLTVRSTQNDIVNGQALLGLTTNQLMFVTKRSISSLKKQKINTDKEKKNLSTDGPSCFSRQDMRVQVINTLQHYPKHFASNQVRPSSAFHKAFNGLSWSWDANCIGRCLWHSKVRQSWLMIGWQQMHSSSSRWWEWHSQSRHVWLPLYSDWCS